MQGTRTGHGRGRVYPTGPKHPASIHSYWTGWDAAAWKQRCLLRVAPGPGGPGRESRQQGTWREWAGLGGLPLSLGNADWRTATGTWILRILISWGPVATPTCLGAHAPAGWKPERSEPGSKPRPRRALSALGEKLLSAATSQLPGGSLGGKSPTLRLQISLERSDREKQAPESCAWQAGLGNRSLDAISRKFSREVSKTSPVRPACVSPSREVWQGGGPEWRPGARRTEGVPGHPWVTSWAGLCPSPKKLLGTASDQEGGPGAYDQRRGGWFVATHGKGGVELGRLGGCTVAIAPSRRRRAAGGAQPDPGRCGKRGGGLEVCLQQRQPAQLPRPRETSRLGQLLHQQLWPSQSHPGITPPPRVWLWLHLCNQLKNHLYEEWLIYAQPTIHSTQNIFSLEENKTPTIASK